MQLQIQSVLFHNDVAHVVRAAGAIRRAADKLAETRPWPITLHYGDCSREPCLDDEAKSAIADILRDVRFRYTFFGANLGSAEGHNRLAAELERGYVLIQNPDVVGEPSYLVALAEALDDPDCGMAEARQLPIEHPKEYDPETGETGWATTACAMIDVPAFRRLEGFDADTFFLYCDDLDFSWRLRMEGKKVIFQPAAAVFHDKRLGKSANWQPSGAEHYYSIEASLMMAHKWSRPARVRDLLAFCDREGGPVFGKAAGVYRTKAKAGKLPAPIDPEHRVSFFEGDLYSRHRFPL